MTLETTKTIPLTDYGNAQRFARQHAKQAKFAGGRWMCWTGTHWQRDDNGRAMQLAKSTVRAILSEAAASDEPNVRQALATWAIKSESAHALRAMLGLAESEPGIAARVEDFDPNPRLFNLANGTLDLWSGEFKPHDPTDLITRVSPVAFDPQATCPLFEAFLSRIFNGEADLIRFVVRWFGYCLSGDVREELLPILYGEGANGKSTLLGAITYIMGPYAGTAPDSLLTVSRRDEHPTELADLVGRRLVVASETEGNAKLKIQLVKRLTGERRIKARFMHADYFEADRTFKVVLMTNNKPRVREDSEAVWRRLRLIPFTVTIPEAERDPLLQERLKAEAPGILNLLSMGCRLWLRDGLGTPAAVRQATEEYRAESDPLGDFVDSCCVLTPNGWTATGALRAAYERFCAERGDHPVGGKVFAERLAKLGCESKQRYAGRGWQGIALNGAAVPAEADLGGGYGQ